MAYSMAVFAHVCECQHSRVQSVCSSYQRPQRGCMPKHFPFAQSPGHIYHSKSSPQKDMPLQLGTINSTDRTPYEKWAVLRELIGWIAFTKAFEYIQDILSRFAKYYMEVVRIWRSNTATDSLAS